MSFHSSRSRNDSNVNGNDKRKQAVNEFTVNNNNNY